MSGYGGRSGGGSRGGYGGGYGGGSSGYDDDAGLMDDHRQQENAQFMDQQTDDYGNVIRQRDEEVEHIENTMIEVNDIYRDLAQLVDEQGESLDNIENNMVLTDDRVDSGAKQLVKASKYQKQARTKSLYCLGICLAVLAVVFVMAFGIPWKKKDGGSSSSSGAAATPSPTPAPVSTAPVSLPPSSAAPTVSAAPTSAPTSTPAPTPAPSISTTAPTSTPTPAPTSTPAPAGRMVRRGDEAAQVPPGIIAVRQRVAS